MKHCHAHMPQATPRRRWTTYIVALTGACLTLLPPGLYAHEITPPAVPPGLEVPAGHRPFLLGHATGTQNYLCLPANRSFGWAFFGPQATLFNDADRQITTHFLSPNPDEGGMARATWQHSRDTSTVWAMAIESSSDPDFVKPGAIPWLLLQVIGADRGPTGGHRLTETTYMQRVHTSGGLMPTTGCAKATDVGKKALVPYTADYVFYKTPGLQWESGTFSHLPLRGAGDLATDVDSFAHPQSYTALTAARAAQVEAMFDATHTTITAMIEGDLSVNWCAVVDAAGTAGYLLGRYYDTVSSRWFIVGEDGVGTGQASFIINPEPRRDLIVEAPHLYATNARLEGRTDTEGVLVLRQTLGRALLINGADRCQGTDGGCGGTFSSANVCPDSGDGDPYRQSDVAHNTDNAFHVLHQKFNDVSARTQFVQLHGNGDARLQRGGLSVSDGRTTPNTASLATLFVTNIQNLPTGALAASAVNDCATESNILCGYRNVQGRYTNNAEASCSGGSMPQGGSRFLHLEQRSGSPSLIDQPQPVIDALRATFACLGNCSLPAQVVPDPSTVCAEGL